MESNRRKFYMEIGRHPSMTTNKLIVTGSNSYEKVKPLNI
jgi:hypothetical protein